MNMNMNTIKNQRFSGTRLFFLRIGHGQPPHGAILSCRTDGSDLTTLIERMGTHPDGIIVDPARSHLYYTNMGEDFAANDGFIARCDLDGSNNTVVVPRGITRTPKQITIDAAAQKMYWCDREGMRVWRAALDGSNVELLYQAYHHHRYHHDNAQEENEEEENAARRDETNHCVGIAVDAARQRILWTQKGPSKGGMGRLFAAGLEIPRGETPDARSDVVVVMDALPEPIDLELDHEAQMVYKTDRGAEPRGNTVSRIHLDRDGRVVEEILASHLHEAIGLALDKRQRIMYFTDQSGCVYSAAFDGSGKREVVTGMGDLTGICCVHFD